jgi:hypothetical protein
MKFLLTEGDIFNMVNDAVASILSESRAVEVNLDHKNLIVAKGKTAIFKTNSAHVFSRSDERSVDMDNVIKSIFLAENMLASKYEALKEKYGLRNNLEVVNKNIIGKNNETENNYGCLFIELRFYDRADITDENNIQQLEGTDYERIISISTVGYWNGEGKKPLKNEELSVRLGEDNKYYLEALERQKLVHGV